LKSSGCLTTKTRLKTKSERSTDPLISSEPYEDDTDPTFFEEESVSLKDLRMR